jgi:ribosome maturation factor RimP
MKPHEEQIWQLAEPLLASVGMEPVQVECLRMKTRWVVRVFMDREGGVTLDDCAEISNQLGDLLDIHDVPPGPYTLEVSSPGLDRPLRHEADYRRFAGRLAKIVVSEAVGGQKAFAGRIQTIEDGAVLLVEGRRTHRIPLALVTRARLEVEF